MSPIQPLYGPDFVKFVLPLIQKAERSIEVLTYKWKWYPDDPEHDIQQINMSIVAAITRNVKVRAFIQDKVMANFLKSHGIQARVADGMGTLHAKFLIVDGKALVLGSHNMTHRAMGYNIETSLLLEDPDIVNHHLTIFNSLYGL